MAKKATGQPGPEGTGVATPATSPPASLQQDIETHQIEKQLNIQGHSIFIVEERHAQRMQAGRESAAADTASSGDTDPRPNRRSTSPHSQGAFRLIGAAVHAAAEGTNLKALFLLATSLGSLLPGFAFFLDLSPPLLPEVKLLPALAAAAVAIASVWPRKRREGSGPYKRELLRAAAIVLVSLLFVLLYIISYRLTTVSPPVPPPTITCQTGFGLNYLTESASQFINRHPALANSQDLMLAYAAFAGCRTDLIWERWSISVAGVTLIILLLTASTLWAFGFARLARLLPRPSRRTSPKTALSLVLLAAVSLCSCVSERLSSGHAKTAERIRHLEEKVQELDGRTTTGKSSEQPSNQ